MSTLTTRNSTGPATTVSPRGTGSARDSPTADSGKGVASCAKAGAAALSARQTTTTAWHSQPRSIEPGCRGDAGVARASRQGGRTRKIRFLASDARTFIANESDLHYQPG